MKFNNQNLNQLDLFRGLAALFVLIGHCAHITQTSLKPIPGPGHAVDFFMMMSGFLMSKNFHERRSSESWSSRSTFVKFYIRRFFRIAPVYYFFYLIVFLFINKLNYISTLSISNSSKYINYHLNIYELFKSFILHITFMFGVFPKYLQDNILPDWSISLEMQFYIIFPFLIILINKIGRFTPIILCTIIYLASKILLGNYNTPGLLFHYGQPSFLPMKINIFLIGILLGEANFLAKSSKEYEVLKLLGFIFILSLIGNDIITICFSFYFILWNFSMLDYSPIFLTRTFTIIEKRLATNFTTFLANTSFSVYLSHLIVLYSCNAFFLKNDLYIGLQPLARFFLLFSCSIPIIYFISYLVYCYIEFPSIKAGKLLLDYIYQKKN